MRAILFSLLGCGSLSCVGKAGLSSGGAPPNSVISPSGVLAASVSGAPVVDLAGNLLSGEYTFKSGVAPPEPIPSSLAGLPPLEGLRVREYSDGVDLEFDRVDFAVDYRVYPLPPPDKIQTDSDGTLTLPNAVYRCAGQRPGGFINTPDIPNSPQRGNTFSSRLSGAWQQQTYNRQEPDKLMGYVFKLPGPDRVAVYALRDPSAGWGCPFQGALVAASPVLARDFWQRWYTIDELHAKSSTGGGFVNGQYDPSNKPKAIARSFITVKPETLPALDFFADFKTGSPTELFTKPSRCTDHLCFDSANFLSDFYLTESDRNSIGVSDGELTVRISDYIADTGGKVRITSKIPAQISNSTYLHVTMDVTNHVTSRRYPQIIISNAPSPVQDNLEQGTSLIYSDLRQQSRHRAI